MPKIQNITIDYSLMKNTTIATMQQGNKLVDGVFIPIAENNIAIMKSDNGNTRMFHRIYGIRYLQAFRKKDNFIITHKLLDRVPSENDKRNKISPTLLGTIGHITNRSEKEDEELYPLIGINPIRYLKIPVVKGSDQVPPKPKTVVMRDYDGFEY